MWKAIQCVSRTRGWVQVLIDRAERPMIIILHVGILLKILDVSWGDPVISISTMILALMYLLSVSLILDQKEATWWSQVLYKTAFLGCSITLFGLFLRSYSNTGSRTLLLIGALILLLALINILVQWRKYPRVRILDRRGIIRNLAIIIVGLVYFFIS